MSDPKKLPQYTWEEILQHRSTSSLWVVIENTVVDVTDWQSTHPGGADPLRQMAGTDMTNTFHAIQAHSKSSRAVDEWKKRIIGAVDPNSVRPAPPAAQRKEWTKPIKYGLSISPALFWSLVLAAIVGVVALVLWFENRNA